MIGGCFSRGTIRKNCFGGIAGLRRWAVFREGPRDVACTLTMYLRGIMFVASSPAPACGEESARYCTTLG